MANEVENDFKKVLVVSAASFYEHLVVEALHRFACKAPDPRVGEFVKRTVVKRGYSSLFDWDAGNVNGFLAHFGDEFKKDVSTEIKADDDFRGGMAAFIQLGAQRNTLVHKNFADNTTAGDQTVEEIYSSYTVALRFVEHLCTRLCG
jgi:hypothetical protein